MGVFDKAKDKAEQAGGKAKEHIGDATDNEELEAEGKSDQVSGEVKETGHDLRDRAGAAVHDAKERLRDNE